MASHPGLHSASVPGILALDINANNTSRILTGGADKTATIFNKDDEQVCFSHWIWLWSWNIPKNSWKRNDADGQWLLNHLTSCFLIRFCHFISFNFGVFSQIVFLHACKRVRAMQLNLKGNSVKVHIFLEGHKILRNLHRRFVLSSASQIYSGDFAKFCGLFRSYELLKFWKYIQSPYEKTKFFLPEKKE